MPKITAAQLEEEIERRKVLPRTGVFTVFNIGTGHTRAEYTNTIAALGDHCCAEDARKQTESRIRKYVNDGPLGVLGNAQGWGMNDALESTVSAIRKAQPTHVNLAGHSRGAILCHMIAHALFEKPETKHIKISMIVLDPVHQSKLTHIGGEVLDDNPNLLSYHAIIMEHEAQFFGKGYPFKFPTVSPSVKERMHYIKMPGQHGSGSQWLTSPVGKVVYHLMANYLRARRTEFPFPPPTPLEMCDYFASIHQFQPASYDGTKRMIFNDDPFVTEHDPNKQNEASSSSRAIAVANALEINRSTQVPRTQRQLPQVPSTSFERSTVRYFFNEEHAFYFKAAFPYFFRAFAAAPQKTRFEQGPFEADLVRMRLGPSLLRTLPILLRELNPLLA